MHMEEETLHDSCQSITSIYSSKRRVWLRDKIAQVERTPDAVSIVCLKGTEFDLYSKGHEMNGKLLLFLKNFILYFSIVD